MDLMSAFVWVRAFRWNTNENSDSRLMDDISYYQYIQEAQLSQRDRAAACLNFGKNISAKIFESLTFENAA